MSVQIDHLVDTHRYAGGRSWLGLSIATWLATSAVLGALSWCEFYGCFRQPTCFGELRYYGWPAPAAVIGPAAWTVGRQQFHWPAIAIDAIAVLAIALCSALTVETLLRKGRTRFQFQLSDMLLAAATVAMMLAIVRAEPPFLKGAFHSLRLPAFEQGAMISSQPWAVQLSFYFGLGCVAATIARLLFLCVRSLRGFLVATAVLSISLGLWINGRVGFFLIACLSAAMLIGTCVWLLWRGFLFGLTLVYGSPSTNDRE